MLLYIKLQAIISGFNEYDYKSNIIVSSKVCIKIRIDYKTGSFIVGQSRQDENKLKQEWVNAQNGPY